MAARLYLSIILLAGAFAVGPAAGQTARFGQVSVACDESNACVAAIPSVRGDPGSVLQISRQPDSRSRWWIAISTLDVLADRDRPVSLSIDNGVGVTLQPGSDYAPLVRATDFYILSQRALDRLMVRLTAGADLRFNYIDIAGVPHTDRFPLAGLSAALTEIDRRQGRVVGDRRTGPPRGLPPAPDVDAQSLVAAAGIPPRLLDWHLAGSLCEAPGSDSLAEIEPVIAPLSDTAMLYGIPCFRSSGRVGYRLYLNESGEIGGMHLLVFAGYSSRFGWTGLETLEEIAFDTSTGRLTAEDLEPGGCGSRGAWVFDQFAFRMERFEVAEGPSCADSDWKTVYPTS